MEVFPLSNMLSRHASLPIELSVVMHVIQVFPLSYMLSRHASLPIELCVVTSCKSSYCVMCCHVVYIFNVNVSLSSEKKDNLRYIFHYSVSTDDDIITYSWHSRKLDNNLVTFVWCQRGISVDWVMGTATARRMGSSYGWAAREDGLLGRMGSSEGYCLVGRMGCSGGQAALMDGLLERMH